MWLRLEQWKRARVLDNELVLFEERASGVLKGVKSFEYAFQCSHLNCRVTKGLRLTPSGIWCRRHYLSLPACAICPEPVVLDKDYFRGNIYCRNHLHLYEDREKIDGKEEEKEGC